MDCFPSIHCEIQISKGAKTTPLSSILKATQNFLKKIITREKILFAFLLFNTWKKEEENGKFYKGVKTFIKIDELDAHNISQIIKYSGLCDPEINKVSYEYFLKKLFALFYL